MGKLTLKQEAFCRAYIENGGNASEAYRRVYDVSPDTKPNTVEKRACELLKNGKVAGRIAELQAKHQKRHEVTVDRIVQELAKIGFANAGDYFKWGPDGITVKDSRDLTEDQRSVIAEVSETRTKDGGSIRVKLSDKQGALEKLGRHLGMFKEVREITGKDGGAVQVETKDVTDVEAARRIAFMLGKAVGKQQAAKNVEPA